MGDCPQYKILGQLYLFVPSKLDKRRQKAPKCTYLHVEFQNFSGGMTPHWRGCTLLRPLPHGAPALPTSAPRSRPSPLQHSPTPQNKFGLTPQVSDQSQVGILIYNTHVRIPSCRRKPAAVPSIQDHSDHSAVRQRQDDRYTGVSSGHTVDRTTRASYIGIYLQK